jgi:integrase
MGRPATGEIVEKDRQHGTMFALRFRAYGERRYVTLGGSWDGWSRTRAEDELSNVLADVRRGIWRPPEPAPLVETPKREPTFHEFASEWLDARRYELSPRTVEDYQWALTCHLLEHFAGHRLSEITIETVDRYRQAKVRERGMRRAAIDAGRPLLGADGRVLQPLSPASLNKTITRLGQVLDVAVEYGHLTANPARGRRRREKTSTPHRARLEGHHVAALLRAAGGHRALLATAIMAGGLRVSELTALRWRDTSLAEGWLRVACSKTDAGVRRVELAPDLLDELKAHRAASRFAGPDDFVFPTRTGTQRERNAVRRRILYPAIERANVELVKAGRSPIPGEVTFHSLRRTYASLSFEAGADPAYVQAQIGHKTARLTLEVYTDVGNRTHAANARLGALLRSDEWAPLGTSGVDQVSAPTVGAAEGFAETA